MFVQIAVASLVCLSLVQNAFALKCYKCNGAEDCKTPAVVTCMKQKDGLPAPDSCWIHRETTIINSTKVVIKDSRDCKYAYRCIKTFHCNETAGDKCEAGCCKEDLCNHHGFIPPKPKYHKPSGSDLSCYSCSDLPKHVLRDSLPAEQAKCSSPAKKTCGVSTQHPKLKQDRCITFEITEKIPNSEDKKLEYRTCGDISFCALRNLDWNFVLKQYGMMSSTAKASCCDGNLCNGGYVTRPQTGLTCLTGLVVLVLYWMN